MINMDIEHKEFEETLLKSGFSAHHLRKDKKGNYIRKNVASAFQGWIMKASRGKGSND